MARAVGSGAPGSWGRVVVIMPTYNEIDSLPRVLAHLLQTVDDVDVLVVDDSSPDGTGEFADTASAADLRVHVLHNPAKGGLGRAYVLGFEWAERAGYDIVVEMDSDGSHPADSLPSMLDALVGSDGVGLVIGSRWVRGGSVVNWPRRRLFLSRTANAYARAVLRLPVADVTAGYRAYPISVLPELSRDVDSRGYSFQVEMAMRVHDAGLRIIEIPIEFREREAGVSKMSGSVVIEAMARVTAWGLERAFTRDARRSPAARPSDS